MLITLSGRETYQGTRGERKGSRSEVIVVDAANALRLFRFVWASLSFMFTIVRLITINVHLLLVNAQHTWHDALSVYSLDIGVHASLSLSWLRWENSETWLTAVIEMYSLKTCSIVRAISSSGLFWGGAYSSLRIWLSAVDHINGQKAPSGTAIKVSVLLMAESYAWHDVWGCCGLAGLNSLRKE